jgi:hypothetical protein
MVAGVIPFLLLTLCLRLHWFPPARVSAWLFSYAAVILTFLGGIQWGIGVMRLDTNTSLFPHLFTLSILPSLAAWLLLLLNYPKLQLIGFILGFIAVLAVDIGLALREMIPGWFLKLRCLITLVVVTLLLLSYRAIGL